MSDPLTGRILGKVQLLEKVGSGGMAEVYKGVQAGLDRPVAVKVLARADADRDRLRRFQREALATAKLSHPNIVTIYDSGEQDGLLYFVMEYLEAGGLDALLRETGRLPAARAAAIARDVLKALVYMHGRHILHRDLKPSNIRFDLRGNAVVTDFGLARDLEQTGLTASGLALGTPLYMSPEQLRGEAVDERSDLFQAGLILFEMLTGSAPPRLTGPGPSGGDAACPAPSSLEPSVPAGLDELVLRATARQRDRRFPAAQEMLERLNRVELRERMQQLTRESPEIRQPTPVAGPSEGPRVDRPDARSRTRLSREAMTALAVLLAVAAGFGWTLLHSPVPAPPATAADLAPRVRISEVAVRLQTAAAELTWVTDVPADTTVRYGCSGEPELQLTALGSAAVTRHRLVLRGLEPLTTYTFRIVASPAGPDRGRNPDQPRSFRTPAAAPPVVGPTTAPSEGPGSEGQRVIRAYIEKVGQLSPSERTSFDRKLLEFAGAVDAPPTPERKAAAAAGATSTDTFAERVHLYRAWRDELLKRHPSLGPELRERLVERVERLYAESPPRAFAALDRLLTRLRELERLATPR